MMRALADAGADSRVVMSDGTTALMAAVQGGRGRVVPAAHLPADRERNTSEAMKLAIALGVDVAAQDEAGNTAMHYATLTLRPALVQVLADNGARVNATNKQGLTPLAFLKVPRPRETEAPPDNGRTPRMVDFLHKLGAHD
jgi:ankyrin repeat protein